MDFFPIAVCALSSSVTALAPTSEIWVTIDHARFYEASRPIGSIVVGNPGVADVTVRSPQKIILFGKLPGATNITLFDNREEEITTLSVRVRNPSSDVVTLQAGPARYTFSCTTVCEQVPAIGDGTTVARMPPNSITQQVLQKQQMASGAGGGPAQGINQPVAGPSAGEQPPAPVPPGQPGS